MKIRLLVLGVLVGLFGCATRPVSVSEAIPVPKERLIETQHVKEGGTSGTVVVTRDEGFLGGGCYYALYINGVLAARFNPSETATFEVASGEVLFKVVVDPEGRGLCSINTGGVTQRESTLKTKEVKFFRISIQGDGTPDLQRTDGAQVR